MPATWEPRPLRPSLIMTSVTGSVGPHPGARGLEPKDAQTAPPIAARQGAGNLSVASQKIDARIQAALAFAEFLGPPVLRAPQIGGGTVSAAEVIYEAEQKRKEQAEAELGPDGLKPKNINFKPFEEAANRYASDIGSAVSRWVQNNSSTALNFGVQVLSTVVKGIATGGTSLAVDGPKLGAAALAIASGVAAEAGLSLDKVVGDFSSAALQSLGVDKAHADKWGKTIASMSGAAFELTMAYTSGGSYKIDPSKFGSLAKDFAEAVGIETATAAMVATTVTGLATVGLAIAGGKDLASLGSFDGLMKSAQGLASKLAEGLMDGKLNIPELLQEGTASYTAFQKLLADFEQDTGIQDFWRSAGPLAEKLAQSALASLVGFVAPNQPFQA